MQFANISDVLRIYCNRFADPRCQDRNGTRDGPCWVVRRTGFSLRQRNNRTTYTGPSKGHSGVSMNALLTTALRSSVPAALLSATPATLNLYKKVNNRLYLFVCPKSTYQTFQNAKYRLWSPHDFLVHIRIQIINSLYIKKYLWRYIALYKRKIIRGKNYDFFMQHIHFLYTYLVKRKN